MVIVGKGQKMTLRDSKDFASKKHPLKLRSHVKGYSFIKNDTHGGKKRLTRRIVTAISILIICITNEYAFNSSRI